MIDHDRLLQTFLDIVQIDSPTGYERNMAKDLARRLKQLGLKPHVDHWSNVTTTVPGNTNKKPKILNAHIDTVEPGRGIKPIIVDNIIKSSSDTILASDNKASVAAILETTQTLAEEGFKHNSPLDLVFTVHKESQTDGPRLIDYKRVKSRTGYSFDATLPLGTITMASPFYNRIDFRIDGTPYHASKPELAANALSVTIDALSRFSLGQVDEETVRNMRIADAQTITGEQYPDNIHLTRNTVPGAMVGRGEIRSFNERLLEIYTLETKIAFIEAIGQNPYRLTFESVRENGGFKYDRTDPDIHASEEVLRKLEFPIEHNYGFGCYDANVFAEKGVKIINLGNGTLHPHTKEESMSVENLIGLGNLVHAIALSNSKNI